MSWQHVIHVYICNGCAVLCAAGAQFRETLQSEEGKGRVAGFSKRMDAQKSSAMARVQGWTAEQRKGELAGCRGSVYYVVLNPSVVFVLRHIHHYD
jgi:hypothetical protein